MTCQWQALTSDADSEYGISYAAEPTTIKCYKWNDNGQNFKIGNQAIDIKSITTYIVDNESVKEGDMIDGLIINSISVYRGLNGKYLFTSCGVN